MKIGILLSGCGVYDGAEIQESVLSMLAVEKENAEYVCISIDKNQHHVINHLNGEEMKEQRNMMTEAARISRGVVTEISDVKLDDIDGLLIPGGFGSAKNLTKWAFEGPDGEILPEVKLLLVNLYNIGKPIVALCVSPVVLAKAFEGTAKLNLTIGSDKAPSSYDIQSFCDGLEKTGMQTEKKTISEILIDEKNKIITAPCYMMDAKLLDIQINIDQAVFSMVKMIKESA